MSDGTEIQSTFSKFQSELQQLAQKIGEFESEAEEYEYVFQSRIYYAIILIYDSSKARLDDFKRGTREDSGSEMFPTHRGRLGRTDSERRGSKSANEPRWSKSISFDLSMSADPIFSLTRYDNYCRSLSISIKLRRLSSMNSFENTKSESALHDDVFSTIRRQTDR
jgi:hypothetical protein